MQPTSPATITEPAPKAGGEILVAVEAGVGSAASSLRERIAERFPGCTATILVAAGAGEPVLVDAGHGSTSARDPLMPGLVGGGIAGHLSVLRALLGEADRRGAVAAALLSSGAHDEEADWLALLLQPVLAGTYDYVCPSYRRERFDGMLNTAIVYPLVRALFGRQLRQPIGGESAVSLPLARALLRDPAWGSDPAHAGSDAWLVASVLRGRFRVCQAWLGRRPEDPGPPEDASHTLARVVGPVFHEMDRHAERWQRLEGSEPVPSFGCAELLDGRRVEADARALEEAFRLGLSELGSVWGLVLPPATLLALRRCAAAPAGRVRLDDALWARIVYDFAVAHSIRTVERRQLLHSMTPLYLGWVAGFIEDVQDASVAGVEARVEALCLAFEREKPYAVARWRWPDGFNP
jgi:hypothetical protein